MARITLTKDIEAQPERVFAVFTDFEKAPQAVTGIERLELLTDGPVGKGTRFRETRIMFKREATEEMEITAFDPGQGYTVEAESCGSHFKTDFRFVPIGRGTRVEMEVDCKPTTFMAKVMSPISALMMGPMKKCIQKDFDDLRAHVEGDAGAAAQPA